MPEARRLAAIVAMDVAGYSRLMGRDESGTVSRLKLHRTVIESAADAHNGRRVSFTGDGMLLEFPSAVDAVSFAVQVQADLEALEIDRPEAVRMRHRVGVNVGDIMVDDGDLFGDGVNVAARLEACAPPGGICLSRSVRDQIRDRMEITLDDLGALELKNITRPIRAFSVQLDSIEAPAAAHSRPSSRSRRAAVLAVTQVEAPPEAPRLASIGQGLAESLVVALSHFDSLDVIGPLPSRDDPAATAANYLVTARLQGHDSAARLQIRLVDNTDGRQLWANAVRWSGDAAEWFDLEDEIVDRLSATVGADFGVLARAQWRNVEGRRPDSLEAFEAVMLAQQFFATFDPNILARARVALEAATQREPGYATAWAWYGGLLQEMQVSGFVKDDSLMDAGRVAIDRAVSLEPDNQRARLFLVEDLFHRRRLPEAIREAERVVALDVLNAGMLMPLGFFMAHAGACERGLTLVAEAEAAMPYPPPWRHIARAVCALFSGNWEEMRRAAEMVSGIGLADHFHVGALGRLDLIDEARAVLAEREANFSPFLADLHGGFMGYWRAIVPYWLEPEVRAEVEVGLGAAGAEV